jgi:hypothetical protein
LDIKWRHVKWRHHVLPHRWRHKILTNVRKILDPPLYNIYIIKSQTRTAATWEWKYSGRSDDYWTTVKLIKTSIKSLIRIKNLKIYIFPIDIVETKWPMSLCVQSGYSFRVVYASYSHFQIKKHILKLVKCTGYLYIYQLYRKDLLGIPWNICICKDLSQVHLWDQWLSFLHFYNFWFCCRKPENIYPTIYFCIGLFVFRSIIHSVFF